MTTEDVLDYQPFVPAYWTQILTDTPILGGRFEIVDLDAKFIEYLESDGMYLEETQFTSQFSDSDEQDPEEETEQEDTDILSFKPSIMFPKTHCKIENALKSLGGCVVPKVNWTVPKDSIWISANTLKCTSANEIYQLLKASDRIQSDLQLAKEQGIQPKLMLTPFVELNTELEFRALVIDNELIAISQRNLDIFKEYVLCERDRICDLIEEFFSDHLAIFPQSTYAFDVYVELNAGKVFLVDLNPLNSNTNTLLFSFEDIAALSKQVQEIKFMCLKSNEDTRIALCQRNFLPLDLLHANSDVNQIDFNNL